jgi:transposase-like protein
MSRSTISTFQLFEAFPDENAARLYLESRLWPDGVCCPNCKSGERITTRKRTGFYRCNACENFDFTVRTGTVFERSKVPLHKWLYAMYLLVTARKGISSLQLAKEIGITQKSAWFVLHRLREACSTPEVIAKLKGIAKELDAVVDAVLAYKPKPKTKAAKRRVRKAKRESRKKG